MSSRLLYDVGMLAMAAPFLILVAITIQYKLRRAAWKRKTRKTGRTLGFCPSSAAMATAFLFIPVFYRPTVALEIEARQRVDVDEDDEGDQETPAKHLHRQLRRIRRGDPGDRLVVRL